MNDAYFYRTDEFGDVLTPCKIIARVGPFVYLRFETYWTDTGEYTWRKRVKFSWNVEVEDE